MEKKNVMNFQEVMKTIQTNTGSGSAPYAQLNNQQQFPFMPIPIPYQQPNPGGDMMEKMMKMMFMKKMMQKMDMEMDDDSSESTSFGSDDDEKFAEMLFFNKNKNRRTVRHLHFFNAKLAKKSLDL